MAVPQTSDHARTARISLTWTIILLSLTTLGSGIHGRDLPTPEPDPGRRIQDGCPRFHHTQIDSRTPDPNPTSQVNSAERYRRLILAVPLNPTAARLSSSPTARWHDGGKHRGGAMVGFPPSPKFPTELRSKHGNTNRIATVFRRGLLTLIQEAMNSTHGARWISCPDDEIPADPLVVPSFLGHERTQCNAAKHPGPRGTSERQMRPRRRW